jgi:hypothetical protein
VRPQQRLDDDPLGRRPDHEDDHPDDRGGDERVDTERAREDVSPEHAEHHELGVREVDDVHDPVHEGQADGDQRVHQADQCAVQDGLS